MAIIKKEREEIRKENIKKFNLEDSSREQIINRIINTFLKEPEASDLLLCLFSASLISNRKTITCDPFPHFFYNEQGEPQYTVVVC